MKKIFLILIFIIFFCASVSAIESLGTFKFGDGINLIQNCANSSYSYISSLLYPNSSFAIYSQANMTKNIDDYNYTFKNTFINGQYQVYGQCDEFGVPTNWAYTFIITPTGQTLDTSKSILYFVALFISFLIFGITLWAGIALPNRQTKNPMTGYIIAVDNIKYLKMLLIAFSYLILMLILHFAYIISYAYLDLDFLANIFKFGFYFMVICLVPLFIISVYVVIANIVRDNKIADMLSGGLRFREGDDI